MNRHLFRILISTVFCLLSINQTFAQKITGTVTDQNKTPVADAKITLLGKSKIIAGSVTDREGKFSFDINPSPNMILRVDAAGFSVFSKPLAENPENLSIILSPASISAEVTVSVTQTASRLNETPASIVVLNRADLSATAAQTIDDSLRQVAGFTLFRRGSSKTTNPTTQGANLRGIGGSGAARTAVLFDGISLNDAFGGWTYWTRVPKIAVEQAEVLRGGASSLYGNSALSGAVSLQTKKSDQPVLRFEFYGGGQKTFDGSVFASAGKNGWFFDFAAESFQTAGYIPIAPAQRGLIDTKSNSRYNNGFFTVERKFSKNYRIFARANLFKEQRDNGTSLTNNRTYFQQAVFGADLINRTYGTFQFRSSIESQTYDQTFSSISTNRATESLTRLQRVPSQAVFASLFWTKVFSSHALNAAGEVRTVRGFSDENVISNNRSTSFVSAGGKQFRYGLSIQDFWRVSRKLNVNFGGRFDAWHEFSSLSTMRSLITSQSTAVYFPNRAAHNFSPRISAIYQLSKIFSLFGGFSDSFRAPTLNELYRAFRVGNVLTQANENLLAEKARTFEGGLNFYGFSNRLSIRGNVFRTTVSNPVVSVTLSTTPVLITRQRQNVGQTQSDGLEIDAEYSPYRTLKFSAGYLLVDSRVASFPANSQLINKFLPQIPKNQLTLQTFYRPRKKISINVQSRFSGAQFDDDLNLFRLRPFFVADVFSSYQVTKKLGVFIAIENILNNRYDIGLTPNLTIAAPRFVRAGLSFDLNAR